MTLSISLILGLDCSPHYLTEITQKFTCFASLICSFNLGAYFQPPFPLLSLNILSSLFFNPSIPSSSSLRANGLMQVHVVRREIPYFLITKSTVLTSFKSSDASAFPCVVMSELPLCVSKGSHFTCAFDRISSCLFKEFVPAFILCLFCIINFLPLK